MFSNRKTTLGFAGVTVVVALAASFSASTFITAPAAPDEAVPEAVIQDAPIAAAAAPDMAWDDEGFSDDWNSSAVDVAVGNESSADEIGETGGASVFGDYAGQSENVAHAGPQSAAGSGQRSGSNAPTITSGAAPGAPPINPPGSNENAALERAD